MKNIIGYKTEEDSPIYVERDKKWEEVARAPESIEINGMVRYTDVAFALHCPDVCINVKQMGKKTSIRVEPREKVNDDDPFVEIRFNTIPEREALEKAIIKTKLIFDGIFRGKK